MIIRATCLVLATGIGLLTLTAHAGGPVIIEGEEPPLVAGDRDQKSNLLPILIGIGILAIIAGSGGSNGGTICNGDTTPTTPDC
jgi:hypothetical protein